MNAKKFILFLFSAVALASFFYSLGRELGRGSNVVAIPEKEDHRPAGPAPGRPTEIPSDGLTGEMLHRMSIEEIKAHKEKLRLESKSVVPLDHSKLPKWSGWNEPPVPGYAFDETQGRGTIPDTTPRPVPARTHPDDRSYHPRTGLTQPLLRPVM